MREHDNIHPQDMRNLIIFGACSLLLWLGYTNFVLNPQKEKMREAQQVQAQATVQAEKAGLIIDERPREELIQSEIGDRLKIDTPAVFGSINLTGARLDDLGLKNYYKTVKREENSIVLHPKGTAYPQYVENGWVSSDKNLKVPGNKTRWSVFGNDTLTPTTPVILQWNNGNGVTFEQKISINNDYLFQIEKTVQNKTGSAITLHPYSIIARRDIPEEYSNRFVVHEGPIGFFNNELHEETYGKMKKKPLLSQSSSEGWVGLTTKDWHTALIPEQGVNHKFRIVYTKSAAEGVKDLYQTDVTGDAIAVQSGEQQTSTVHVYSGAKKLSILKKHTKELNVPNFDLAVDFGWFFFLTKPFFHVINFFYGLVGNFGVAIVLFTVLLRICVFPLANTSFKSFANMRKIGPEMAEIREKYKDDKTQQQQELVKLYQREKVNPMAGCLPILVQIPIFFSLFKVLSNTIEMRHAPFFGWIQDLSAPDPTTFWNLFGLLPWNGPGFLEIGAWPILMLLTMILQRKLSPPPADKTQAFMFAALPWIMTVILAGFASGLVIYWTFNNFFSTIQQYIIMTRMGVKVDLIGNILGRNNKPAEEVVSDTDTAKEAVEEKKQALIEKGEAKKISKPKPKKSKKKK